MKKNDLKRTPRSKEQVLQRAKKLLSDSDRAMAHLDKIIYESKEKRLH
ncbi:hypothetical protein P3535_22955 [Vibrio parahaemolyticus]|nr:MULTISPECIES: hypothetical protein [Vibrio]HDM8193795.1 hypothetical protein [Vibrio harveyi]EJC6937263.1 hypothetical protein [Vibrio parahaemolyticus]EJC7128120.1 hypothetical protein [Vibrio parahaemolyticus]EJG0222324.1 hypothetical protein [Vibrio parahaemolyticus]EJG0232051.1 hypothetical protein [Vibrio parahaemolyticus]